MSKRFSFISIINTILKSDLVLPFILLASYGAFLFVIRGVLPNPDELLRFFSIYYAKFGYEIIFVAALLEGLVLVNLFAPGQVALALGIIFARTGETSLPLIIIAVVLGALTGYMIDFLIGLYGFGDILKRFGQGGYVEKAKKELQKAELKSLFVSFIHENIASYMSLAAGTVNYNAFRFFFIALFSTIFWTIAWSILIYSLGDFFLVIIRKFSLILGIIFIGFLIFSLSWSRIKKS